MKKKDAHQAVRLDDLWICFEKQKIYRDAQEIPLSTLSFQLLQTLLEYAPEPLSHDALIHLVWNGVITGEENVKQRISLLRKALSDESHQYIHTKRGQGYFISSELQWIAKDSTQHRQKPSMKKWTIFGTASSLFCASIFVSYLYFSEGSTASSNTGRQVKNGPVIYLAPEQLDKAYCLDGYDDYVEFADQDHLDVEEGDFSIEAWIRTNSLEQRVILDKRYEDQVENVHGYVLYIDEGNISLQLATGRGSWYCHEPNASCSIYESQGFIADGQWHHLIVSVDRDNQEGLRFYQNGELVTVQDPTDRQDSLANDSVLRVGSRSSYLTGLFDGDIGDLNLFHRRIGPREVKQRFAKGNSRRCYSIGAKGGLL
ncbi:LamG-like jellyroll fold domain-containing protein [Algicola sagamiensis]|uniref:LamG-like jellyroll fold domain-containing protein n=1 Tax=Algicola sagamiensis TaxID=163869 RepID=UPI00036ABAF4|nr:LamG-like jellyroll fold domain-containing protein [Algicola sagamiensis]